MEKDIVYDGSLFLDNKSIQEETDEHRQIWQVIIPNNNNIYFSHDPQFRDAPAHMWLAEITMGR